MVPDLSTLSERTEVGFVQRRASGWMTLGLAEWAARLAVALVFVLGMFATASATRVENESDVSVEGGEDCEVVEQVSAHANTPRRFCAGAGAPVRKLEAPPIPRSLIPRRPEPPRPSWLRPRRTVPPDDDDESLV